MAGYARPAEYVGNLAKLSEKERKNPKSIMERPHIFFNVTRPQNQGLDEEQSNSHKIVPVKVLHSHR